MRQRLQLQLLLPLLLFSSSCLASSCGYSGCHAPVAGRLNAHLVPHSHDDVGWLRTVDQYFYYEVQFIIDTVVEQLLANSERKFTYVEVAYFYRWWREQTEQRQQQVRDLVSNGQLQFALGGWCMDDEATTHYVDIIDQHTEGLRFLNETFGDCGRPRVAWQVDPFGHSKEHTALLAQMGFDGLYFGRIDFEDVIVRRRTRRMEMVWQASQDIGSPQADLFSGKLYDSYCTPSGFSYETGDEPVQDDANLYDYNVERKVQEFVKMVHKHRQVYSSDHIMLTMGCDFQYQNARINFKIYDKLIKAVNERTSQHNVTVYYSTPSCYTKAVNQQKLTWTTKTDDFFPYAHIPHGYWTGYFTSRAALKHYVRQLSNVFQAVKQLTAVSGLQRSFDARKAMEPLRQAMGVVQHHDGVSGTEKQVVAYDYAQRMSAGADSAVPLLGKSWSAMTGDQSLAGLQLCPLANISKCPFTDSHDSFYVHVYNPLSHSVWQLVRLPVRWQYYVVSNEQQQVVQSQTIPVSAGTRRVPERKGARSQFELVFNVTRMPAMGFAVYRVAKAAAGQPGASTFTPIVADAVTDAELETLTNEEVEDSTLRYGERPPPSVVYMETQAGQRVQTDMAYYYGFIGNNSKPEFTSSGAYLFRPTEETPQEFRPQWSGRVTGPIVNESHVSWSNWTYQVRRRFAAADRGDPLAYEENEFTVGPIPIDGQGREVIVRYDTRVRSAGAFFTDSNGRQELRRVRDQRPTWPLNQTEKVAGNYYPVNSFIFVNDSTSSFSVLTDRSQGGGSIRDGQLEVMLHRVTVHDDSLGVGEPLQERGSDGQGLVVKATHWFFGGAASAGRKRRELASRRYREPVVGFLATRPQRASWSCLRKELPPSLQVVSLDDWRGVDIKLLRLEHLYQRYEDSSLSGPQTVDLSDLFATFDIVEATELTLGANQEAAKAQRLRWRTAGNVGASAAAAEIRGTTVTLTAMQIRTFVVKVKFL